MEQISINIQSVRRAALNGREYLVAPLTMIVPGVLRGSKGALYYPPEEIARNVDAWNGVPLVVYHPMKNGQHVSARSPEIAGSQEVGRVYNAEANGKLTAEGWFDVEALRRVDNRVLKALESGQPMELSTGLFTDNEPAENGATYDGKPYQFVARNYRPDHLAILPDQKGACSVNDGCGVNVNAKRVSLWNRLGAMLGINQQPSEDLSISPEKACQIVKDGEVHGNPLTEAQRGMFGALCGETKNAAYPWDQCIADQMKEYGDKKTAEEVCGSIKAANNSEVNMTRDEVVKLVANCDCYKGYEKVVNEMSDDQLKKVAALVLQAAEGALVVNAARETLPGAKDAKAEELVKLIRNQDAAMTDEEKKKLAEEEAAKKKLPPVASNAALPPDVQEMLADYKSMLSNERDRHVSRLLGNAEGPAADAAKKAYATLDIHTLRTLSAALPTPVGQAQSLAPLYYGAAAPVMNRWTPEEEQSDIDAMTPPTINYAELAARKAG